MRFFLCLLCSSSLFSQTLGDRLAMLRPKDAVVYDFQQSVTVIRVASVSDTAVELQAAAATKDVAEREGFSSWLAWADGGCPGASTQETFLLSIKDRPTLLTPEARSAGWLMTLFGLPSASVPTQARRKAGPAPMPGEIDLRSAWQPRIVVNGKTLSLPSEACSFDWPADNSILSGRTIIAYFPKGAEAVPAFPYWLESPSSSARASVIDSRRDVNIFAS